MNSALFDGKLEPKYATVYAGLKNPLFPLFRTPFQTLPTFANGLSNKKLQTWHTHSSNKILQVMDTVPAVYKSTRIMHNKFLMYNFFLIYKYMFFHFHKKFLIWYV